MSFILVACQASREISTFEKHGKKTKKSCLAGQRALYEKETGTKVLSSLNFLPENRDKYLKDKV